MYNNILHCTYKCKIFPRLSDVCYCTAYYNIEKLIFLQYRLFIKKNIANQYIEDMSSLSFHLTFLFIITNISFNIV